MHPVLPSKKVKVKAHLDSPPRTRPSPQLPEWLSCLHLIETPELIDREIGEDNSTNCYVIKNNINNHNKSHDMRQTITHNHHLHKIVRTNFSLINLFFRSVNESSTRHTGTSVVLERKNG